MANKFHIKLLFSIVLLSVLFFSASSISASSISPKTKDSAITLDKDSLEFKTAEPTSNLTKTKEFIKEWWFILGPFTGYVLGWMSSYIRIICQRRNIKKAYLISIEEKIKQLLSKIAESNKITKPIFIEIGREINEVSGEIQSIDIDPKHLFDLDPNKFIWIKDVKGLLKKLKTRFDNEDAFSHIDNIIDVKVRKNKSTLLIKNSSYETDIIKSLEKIVQILNNQ